MIIARMSEAGRRMWRRGFVLLLLASSGQGSDAVDFAIAQLPNAPDNYQWGAKGPVLFDCSGLVYYSYKVAGVTLLPGTADDQMRDPNPILQNVSDSSCPSGLNCTLQNLIGNGTLRRGDLLFFHTYTDATHPLGSATHVGLFVAGTTMIDAYWFGFGVRYDDVSAPPWTQQFLSARRVLIAPPVPVSLSMGPRYTAANYLGLFWSRSTDAGFASYKLYRAAHPNVTTSDQLAATITDNSPQNFYFRDGNLAPGIYYYKVFVFTQTGASIGSNELNGRVFSASEVVHTIPGVPEPGDTSFPSNVAIPNLTLEEQQFDCTVRSTIDPAGTCLGVFVPIGPTLDSFGHVSKYRFFGSPPAAPIVLENLMLNGIPAFEFILHNVDIFHVGFLAKDDNYSVTVPDYGIGLDIQMGATRVAEFGVFCGVNVGVNLLECGSPKVSQIGLRNSLGNVPNAGLLAVMP